MIIFYIVCCLVCFALLLCNLYFAENKLTGGQSVGFAVVSLIPFVNALLIASLFYVACQMVKVEIEKENK